MRTISESHSPSGCDADYEDVDVATSPEFGHYDSYAASSPSPFLL
jgi:hypothetical protein